jgi:hypothetical protein|tara:strand:- start:329 stop:514 length:186 start_codon:yes stop_codon:yes gene_type:complete
MQTLIQLFEWLVSIADAVVYGVLYFFAIILITLAFATAGPDDYWAEGGMPLSNSSSMESTE